MKYIPTILAIAICSAGLHAQSATEAPANSQPEANQLPTTIVTGSLWDSELERTTASVTVIDQARLATNGTQHFEDIVNAIPNLTWTGGSSRPRYIQIRGIGENSQFEGETPDSAVRFLIDDLDLTGLGTVGNLFDVQQVEVLRGPQAGAFGANAAGGVIRIVTNEPTPYWTGQVEGTVGEDSLVAGGLAVGGPIIESDPEKLTFRLALHQLNQDGFRDNKFLDKDDTNRRDELTARLKLRWIANDDWQWDGTLLYADANNGYDEWSRNNTDFDTYSDEPGRDEQKTVAGSIRGTWTGLDSIDITTITSISDTDSLNSADGDFGNTTPTRIRLGRQRTRWSQELRIDSTEQEDALGLIDRWTTGLYFEELTEHSKFGGSFGNFETDYETEIFSLFAQGTHLYSEATRLIVGIRAEHYDLTTDIQDRENVDFDDLLIGGKITLEHDLSDAHMLFTSIARGYKAGGANIFPDLGENLPIKYNTETLWNYEAGLRSAFFDGAVISQFTLFYLDRENAQLRDSDGEGVDFMYFTSNGEDARHYGLEAEATWLINKNWSIHAALGLLKATRDSYTDPSNPALSIAPRTLSNAPSYNYSARIDYAAANGFFANIEVLGRDEYYESNSHKEKRNAFAVANSSIGYRYEKWTFTLWAKNLFDEGYEKRLFFFNNGFGEKRYENPADPQQFGITANYRW